MTASPTTYSVRARSEAGGRAELDTGSASVPFDAAWATGSSTLPGPAELLAGAFAACVLKNTERASRLLPFRYEYAEVDVVARRQDAPPQFVEITYELRVTTDESDHRVELLHRNVRRFGTVYNTLAAACTVDGRAVAIRKGDDR